MFTREDLKTGLFVKLKDGDLGIVANEKIVLQRGTCIDILSYEEDLHYPANADCNIIEVRGGGMTSHIDCFNNFHKMDLKYKRNSFTLDKIENGDIVTINCAGMPSFYKIDSRLVPRNNTDFEAYSLKRFDENLQFILNPAIRIVKVIRPTVLAGYADSGWVNRKTVYEEGEE